MAGTIVCGVDGSPGSEAAVVSAARLSERLGLRLVLVHVAQGAAPDGLTAMQARQGGEKLLARTAVAFGLADRAERRLEVGDPVEQLAQVAAEEAADLIVLGARRRGFLRPALRSDLAHKLADATACPVVVVAAQRLPDGVLAEPVPALGAG
jgi:nucleotide-binding universal stress UspA family protein